MPTKLIALTLMALSLPLAGCGTNSSFSTSSSSAGSTAPISVGKKVPPIGPTSTARDIAAYVKYYKGHGYTITANRQAFKADGTIRTFRFAAQRQQGANTMTATATIDAATNSVSTTEDSSSTPHS